MDDQRRMKATRNFPCIWNVLSLGIGSFVFARARGIQGLGFPRTRSILGHGFLGLVVF